MSEGEQNITAYTSVHDVVKRQRWLCCRSLRRTAFCPECGSKRPDVVTSSEAETLADEFKAEAEKCFRAADTNINAAESIRVEYVLGDKVPGSEWQTWHDVVQSKEHSAAGLRKRGNTFARYERVLRELIAKLDS